MTERKKSEEVIKKLEERHQQELKSKEKQHKINMEQLEQQHFEMVENMERQMEENVGMAKEATHSHEEKLREIERESKEKMDDLLDNNLDLQVKLKASEDQVQLMEKQVVDVESHLKKQVTDLELQLGNERMTWQEEKERLVTDAREGEKKNQFDSAKVAALEASCQNKDQQIQELEKELETKLANQNDVAKQKIAELKKRAEAKLAQIKKQYASDLSTKDEAVVELTEKKHQLEEKVAAIERERKVELMALEERLQEMVDTHANETQSLRQQIVDEQERVQVQKAPVVEEQIMVARESVLGSAMTPGGDAADMQQTIDELKAKEKDLQEKLSSKEEAMENEISLLK